ncbi:MAG: 23S rRNA (adenine(2503)-C(2))-methyltransferase RlmN [Chlorobi bacterium]|nr:23S rRNA (adenine(2503)-C(2))-methyltransferase RlmN [Chlorobiota bacterium]
MNHSLPNIKDLTRTGLADVIKGFGEPAYRASQLHQWLFSHRSLRFDDISILSLALRGKLSSLYAIRQATVAECLQESGSGQQLPTTKFLVTMPDGQTVESVLIASENRITACISSQAGCPLDCTFCATGRMGFRRNLSPGEITDQVYLLNDYLLDRYERSKTLTNIVFMGMGEPLLNTVNVLDAIDTLTNQRYRFSFSGKKITISTVGLVPEIVRLGRQGSRTKLAVSLHSAIQEKRESLMPVAKQYPLAELKQALAEYNRATGQPVTLVYMLLRGVNDRPEDARELVKFARALFCKINLIDYNAIVNINFDPVYTAEREVFMRSLLDSGLLVTVRKSHGASIDAACGQLAAGGGPRITEEPHQYSNRL